MTNIQSNDYQSKSLSVSKPAPQKNVFLVMVTLVFILLCLGSLSAYAYFRMFAGESGIPANLIFEEVKRGVFVHEVTDRGNVESAQNEDIRCQVESATGTMIVWIIPEGTVVEGGDVLCQLDPSNLDERVDKQAIVVTTSDAALKQSEANVRIANLALNEYEEGTFPKEEQVILNRISKAEEDLSRAVDVLDYTKKLFTLGYATEMQVKADEAKVKQLTSDLEIAIKELEVIRNYTKPKMLEQLNSAIDTADAKLKADEQSYKIDETRLNYLKQQLENCTIKAPKAGQVVYASPPGPWRRDNEIIKEGNSVRDRQVVIRLPDPKQMQVVGMVNEASVSLVNVGQSATIKLEAMPSHVFNGTVKLVNDYPEPDGIMGSMAKEYKAIVTMDDLDSLPLNLRAGVRPGLTAQIKIDVSDPNMEDLPILVPVRCLFEHAGQYYCIKCDHGKWEKVPVEVGTTNDKEVIIKSGLTEGDRVVDGAWLHIDRVLTEEERTGVRDFGVGGARQRRGGAGGGPGGGPGGAGGSNGGPSGGPGGPGGGPGGPGGGPGGAPDGPGFPGGPNNGQPGGQTRDLDGVPDGSGRPPVANNPQQSGFPPPDAGDGNRPNRSPN